MDLVRNPQRPYFGDGNGFFAILCLWLGLGLLFVARAGFFLPFAHDILMAPDILAQIKAGNFVYAYWILPPARFFFPDFLFYGIMFFLTGGHGVLSLLLLWGTYMVLFVWALQHLFRQYTGLKAPFDLLGAQMTALLILGSSPYLFTLPFGHGGTLILTLLGTFALAKFYKDPALWRLMGLGLLCFLGTFGDPIFALWFVVGAMCTVGFSNFPWRQKLLALFTLGTMTLAGELLGASLILDTSAVYASNGSWHVEDALFSSRGTLSFLRDVILYLPRNYTLFTIFLILGALFLWKRLRQGTPWPWWAPFALCAAFVPWATSMLCGNYYSAANWRYFPFIFIFSVLWVIEFLFKKGYPQRFWTLSVFFFMAYLLMPLKYIVPLKDIFYPSNTHQLDELRREGLLKDGLCYFENFPSLSLNHTDIHLAPLDYSAHPYLIMNDLRNFGIAGGVGPLCNYNFVVRDIPQNFKANSARAVENIFGKPLYIIYVATFCGHGCNPDGSSEIYIYPGGRINRCLEADPTLQRLLRERRNLPRSRFERFWGCSFSGQS
jgi:hypothetical protein